jgi:predicted peptidase
MLAMNTTTAAQDVLDRFEPRVFVAGEARLPYRLLRPKVDNAGRKYPLVVFFHGGGERGNDNRKQLVHGMTDFASDDVMARHPSYVIAPQCPEGVQWVDTPWTADRHTMPDQPTEPLRLSLQLVDALLNEFPIDERRLYVTGLSMGGFGVWDAVQRMPDRFAAAVPICGGGDTSLAGRIKHVPVWAFHGDGDTVVKPMRSRDMVAALREAGGQPRYTEYAKTGHNSWTVTYANREVVEWLFAQAKSR